MTQNGLRSDWKSKIDKMPIWLDDVMCKGSEQHLSECYYVSLVSLCPWLLKSITSQFLIAFQGQRAGGDGQNCGHNEDVYVECADKRVDARESASGKIYFLGNNFFFYWGIL